ncbi:TPA: cytochrome c biogenesis protein CcdA [Candidatus Woesearchaeota archaeon]|nr:cytochrome c biogenesis protein CcdA [Candidatus Woesearchaeota archaeon]HII68428.1 cytochrome c biogenesis protein CcdA [Candidatus Woesearchaeota archaeon]
MGYHKLSRNFALCLTIVIALAAFAPFAFADAHLPDNLQKIVAYNDEMTASLLMKLSLAVAFLAGTLTILSPCILPLLPAYLSYACREKKDITRMTLVFFAGFALVFSAFGIVAGIIGERSYSALQHPAVIVFAGILLVVLGMLSFLGMGFASPLRKKMIAGNGGRAVFAQGLLFALGWTACVGPILGGILGIAALQGSIARAVLLMFFYSLGIFVPLFILSIAYDRFDIGSRKWMQGKGYQIRLFGKAFTLTIPNMISGVLLAGIGAVFIIFRGTGVVNGWNIFGTSQYFYGLQRWLLGFAYADTMGITTLAIFIGIVIVSVIRMRVKKKEGGKDE